MREIPVLLVFSLVAAACAGSRPAPARPDDAGTSEALIRTSGAPMTLRIAIPPPTLAPDERETYARVRANGRGGVLLDAALRAEGLSDPARRRALATGFRRTYEQLLPTLPPADAPPAERLRALLKGLHSQLFRTWSGEQPYVSAALETGTWSELPAALLFSVAAGWLGFETGAAVLPYWTQAWVRVEGRPVIVDVSSPDGWDWAPDEGAYRSFLARRGWPPMPWTTPELRPAAVLVARVATVRLALGHDAVATEGSAQEARWVATVLAVGRRGLALAPEDRISAKMPAIRLERQAVRLVEAGQGDDGFTLQRVVLMLAGTGPEEAARGVQNLRWAAGKLVEAALRDDALARVDTVIATALSSFDCVREPAVCADLKDHFRELFWAEAIARDQAGRGPEAWRLVEELFSRFAAPGRPANFVYFVRAEYDRRFEADPEDADTFLKGWLARADCDDTLRTACAELEVRATGAWYATDPERAATWARAAWARDTTAPGLAESYAAVLQSQLIREAEQHDCARVHALGAELTNAGLATPATDELVARCRK